MTNKNLLKLLAIFALLSSAPAYSCDTYVAPAPVPAPGSDPNNAPVPEPNDDPYYDDGSSESVYIYPINILAAPKISKNGNFTVTWESVAKTIDTEWYYQECLNIELYVVKDGGGNYFDIVNTNDCEPTSYHFTGYPEGAYLIYASSNIFDFDKEYGEEFYNNVRGENDSVGVVVDLSRKRRVTYIHTDILGSPVSESN